MLAFRPWGPSSSNHTTYQTLPLHLIFQLSSLTTAIAVACSPRHHVRTRPRCCTPMVFLWFDFQTRAVIRVRIRCIVIRIRVRHAAIRIRVVVAAINHTVYWGTPPNGVQR